MTDNVSITYFWRARYIDPLPNMSLYWAYWDGYSYDSEFQSKESMLEFLQTEWLLETIEKAFIFERVQRIETVIHTETLK